MIDTAAPVVNALSSREAAPRPVCALCGSYLRLVLDLGAMPLANGLLHFSDDSYEVYPLELGECASCGHVQLRTQVEPDLLFGSYPYRSGMSATMRAHFETLAEQIGNLPKERDRDRIVVCEIGSNDGTLLHALHRQGMKAYGIDPSSISAGVKDTINEPFSDRKAQQILQERGPVDVIVATNVLAHCPDPDDIIKGAATLIGRGVLILEVPYLRDLIAGLAYDTIYHEHIHFWSVHTLQTLLVSHRFRVFCVERLTTHGGSIRIWAKKMPADHVGGWNDLAFSERITPIKWDEFRENVSVQRRALRACCEEAFDLVGYGAPAKATILLNYCGIRPRCLIDTTPEKQGKWLPYSGEPIPIFAPEEVETNSKTSFLVLAWNFAGEIINRERQYAGQWIVPLPQVVTQ